MTKQCLEKGLGKPEFISNYGFQTIIRRQYNTPVTGQVTGQVTVQATRQVTEKIIKLLNVINNQPMSVKEMLKHLSLTGRDNFLKEYLIPAMEQGFVTMKYHQNPNHPKQRYYLSEKGLELKKIFEVELRIGE